MLFLSLFLFQLDDNGFAQHVINKDNTIPWFVMFGSQQCPACTVAAPQFARASEEAMGFARFAYADVRQAGKMAQRLGIFAVPSFFLFTNKGEFEYKGPRTSGGFLSFIAESIGEGLEEVDESWEIDNSTVILFTKRFKPPALFAAVYGFLKSHGIKFGMARDSDVIEHFGNPPVPSIWFYKGDGSSVQYKGKASFSELYDEIVRYYDIDIPEDL